jgi:hypothetical protein
MTETTRNALSTVDSVLAEKELKDQPRTFLLLRLCQLSLLFSQDKTEHYWRQLAPLQSKIPKEFQADLENLRSIMEETSVLDDKGFAAEVIADVKTAKKLVASDVEEAKRRLHDCEERLNKHRWPMGKTPVRIALTEAWAEIDRQYALQMINAIPSNVWESLIQRINRAKPLAAEEWKIVADKVGMKQTVQLALKILDDEKGQLLLSREVLMEVGAWIRDSMRSVSMPQAEAELLKAFARYSKLVKLQMGGDQAEMIPRLLEEMYVFLAKTGTLDQMWSARFILITGLLELAVSSKSLTHEMLERFLKSTPSYLANFVRAHYIALTASASEIEDAYKTLLIKTGQDRNAEAWFLVTLVQHGLGTEAINLAEKSDRAKELLPRLRRAWLCTHPESSGSVISAADMAGDPIGEFLAQGSVQDRVEYLRKTTDGGTRSVPGAMWAGAGTEEEVEGLRGVWKRLTSSKKSPDAILMEYLTLNPLYSSYRIDTNKDNQFSEELRISGYGEYKYKDVDNALLGTLIAWSYKNASEVRSVLHAMWNAIQPDEDILRLDALRNAILTRCCNVLAADPETLIQDFINWFKRELVDKGRYWKIGNMQFTLKFPDTAPLRFCVISAMAVSNLSPTHRDQILLSGLAKFKSDPSTVEAAAQLYNTGKEVLDLAPSLKFDAQILEAWQLGVVKNAIPFIAKTMIEMARG